MPGSRHQLWQAPDLRHLAEPLAAAEAACKEALRHTVRQQVGAWMRQAPPSPPGPAGLWTVTGVLPSPGEEPTAPAGPCPASSAAPPAAAPEAAKVSTQLVCPTRSWRTLKGRAPCRLAGLETYERLSNVASLRLALLAKPYEPRLAQLYQGLQAAFSPCAATSQPFHHGAAWLHDLADIFAPVATYPSHAAEGARP